MNFCDGGAIKIISYIPEIQLFNNSLTLRLQLLNFFFNTPGIFPEKAD
jgi:hypothetical protein